MNELGLTFCKKWEHWLSINRNRVRKLKHLRKDDGKYIDVQSEHTFLDTLTCESRLIERVQRMAEEFKLFDIDLNEPNEYLRVARATIIKDHHCSNYYFYENE